MLKIEITVNLSDEGKLEYGIASYQSTKTGDPYTKIVEKVIGSAFRDVLSVILMLLPFKINMDGQFRQLGSDFTDNIVKAMEIFLARDVPMPGKD